MTRTVQPVDCHAVLAARKPHIPNLSYKLAGAGTYGLDIAICEEPDIDEARMCAVIPFADGNERDGVGDLLEVAGIQLHRHRANPVCLLDHGKHVALPIALAEDPDTGVYSVEIDPVAKIGRARCFFYQGKHVDSITDSGQQYEHALLVEQVFDLLVKRFLRGGSLGYQVIEAEHLPPDYRAGTPQGLHLRSVLMLECSVVVMPANADTVRKMLSMPSVCGKRMSPYLVKSLEPYAVDEPAIETSGYETEMKAIPDSGRIGQSKERLIADYMTPVDSVFEVRQRLEQLKDDIRSGRLSVADARPILDYLNRTGDHLSAFPDKSMKSVYDPVEKARSAILEALRSGPQTFHEVASKVNSINHTDAWEQVRQHFFQLVSEGKIKRSGITSDGLTYLFSLKSIKSIPIPHGDLSETDVPPAKWKPGVGAVKRLGDIRKKYRSVKGLRRRLKHSTPGSSLVYCRSKDLDKLREAAQASHVEAKWLGTAGTGHEKVKLTGDDKACDDIATQFGQRLRIGQKGAKALPDDEWKEYEVEYQNEYGKRGKVRVTARDIRDATERARSKVGQNFDEFLEATVIGKKQLAKHFMLREEGGKVYVVGEGLDGGLKYGPYDSRQEAYDSLDDRGRPMERSRPPGGPSKLVRKSVEKPGQKIATADTLNGDKKGAHMNAKGMPRQNVFKMGDYTIKEEIVDLGREGIRVVWQLRAKRYWATAPTEEEARAKVEAKFKLEHPEAKSMNSSVKQLPGEDELPADLPPEVPEGSLDDKDLADELTGEEHTEPYGAQVLRRLHGDAGILMEEYDEMRQYLEEPNVESRLQAVLESLEELMSTIEGDWKGIERYKDLDPLEGAMDAEDKDLDEEVAEDEVVEDELPAEAKDADTMDDAGVPVGSDTDVDEPDPDEALEGMDMKSLRRKYIKGLRQQYRKDMNGDEKEDEKKSLKAKRKDMPPGMTAGDDVPPPEDINETKAWKGLDDYENEQVTDAAKFLKQLSEPESEFGERERMESYHHHKTLGGIHTKIAPLAAAAIGSAVGGAMGGDKNLPGEPGWEAEEAMEPEHKDAGLDEEVLEPEQNDAALDEYDTKLGKAIKAVGEASEFFGKVANEKAFGDEHRFKSHHFHKVLDELVNGEEQKDLDPMLDEVPNEEGKELPEDEIPVGEMGEKSVKRKKQMNGDDKEPEPDALKAIFQDQQKKIKQLVATVGKLAKV